MYRILVADDEPIAVQSVEFMVRRNFKDQFEITTCASGKQAVEAAVAFHPDIVIMDVDMPGISGIEAIRRIKEQNSTAIFVILSAYDYFDYAQEAMKLGVVEYLLKPLGEESLVHLLRQLITRLEAQSASQISSLEQQEKLLMSIPVLENSFCNALSLLGEYDTTDLENACRLLGHRDVGGYVMILSICPGNSTELESMGFDSICHSLKHTCDCIVGVKKDCVIVYVFDEDGSGYDGAGQIADKIIERVEKNGLRMVAGIGGRYETLTGARRSYQEARSAVNSLKSNENGNKKSILYLEGCLKESDTQEKDDPKYIEEKLYALMDNENPGAVMHEFERYMDKVANGKIGFDTAKNRATDISLGMGRRFGTPQEDARASLDKIFKSKNISELTDAVKDEVVRTAAMLELRKRSKATNIAEQAEAYIQAHYAEPLSLDDVAKHVNLSQHYFSRFFKHEKGIGFADYLTKVRIDHAIELLLTDELTVKEIAYMVGFNDPNYFSKAFKKSTGFTPGDYKSGMEGGG